MYLSSPQYLNVRIDCFHADFVHGLFTVDDIASHATAPMVSEAAGDIIKQYLLRRNLAKK